MVARPIRLGPREPPDQPPADARDIQARREADARRSREHGARTGPEPTDAGVQEKEAAEAEELARQGRDEASAKIANLKQAQISEAAAAQIKAEKMEREAAAMKGAPGAPGKKAFTPPQQPAAMTTLSVRTNPDGTFNIAGTEIGTYQVSVTGAGYIPPPQQTVESPSGGVQFMLQPNARIVGQVIDDETKKPVLAFTLGVTNSPDEVLIPVHTKKPFGPPRFKDGNFEYVDVKPGRYWLVADAPGYAGGRSEEIVIQQGERREGVVINLVRGATIKGRVLDAKGGPVANATVQPDPASLTSNGAAGIFLSVMMQNMRRDIREVKTDAQGNYSIPNMLSGSYTLTVRHPEYGPQTTASFVVPDSGDVGQPDILMSRGATIKGRVKLPDGSPDPKAMVQIAPVGDDSELLGTPERLHRRRRAVRGQRARARPVPRRRRSAKRSARPRDALHHAEEPESLHSLRGRGERGRPLGRASSEAALTRSEALAPPELFWGSEVWRGLDRAGSSLSGRQPSSARQRASLVRRPPACINNARSGGARTPAVASLPELAAHCQVVESGGSARTTRSENLGAGRGPAHQRCTTFTFSEGEVKELDL